MMKDSQQDRATVVARNILQILAQHVRDDPTLRAKLADCLRDEFHDIAHRHERNSSLRRIAPAQSGISKETLK